MRAETVVRRIRSVRGDHWPTQAEIQFAVGCAAVVLSATVAAVVYPPNAVAARAVIMAFVVGVYAAKVAQLGATLGVAGASMLLFTWFLANGAGEFPTPGRDTLGYLFLIAFATVLGRGQRWMRAPLATGEAAADPRQRNSGR
jgi:hypothetical protein